MNKSQVGLILAVTSWPILFYAFIIGISALPINPPQSLIDQQRIMFNSMLILGAVLLLASLILSTWGIRKSPKTTIAAYTVHIVAIIIMST